MDQNPTYAYLVIFPSPVKGNHIYAPGGVEARFLNDNNDTCLVGQNQQVHYIKIGHQKKLAKRVRDYNTHTPSSK